MASEYQELKSLLLSNLPASMKSLHSIPQIQELEKRIRARGNENPMNSHSYDILYSLRKKGMVIRDDKGIYSWDGSLEELEMIQERIHFQSL